MKYKMHKTKFKQTEIGMIPEEWEVGHISDLVRVKAGYAFKSSDFTNHGIGVIKIKNINDGTVDLINTDKISNDLFNSLSNDFVLSTGDVVIAMTGATIGKVGKLRDTDKKYVLNQRVARFISNNKADLEFVFQYTKTKDWIDSINNYANGAAQQNISADGIASIAIPIPPENERKQIAEILSSFDDKIELNQQMNKTLEEIGKAIFKHWFVDFEFPDEEGKPYKSSGGEMVYNEELEKEIPKGWRAGKLSDYFDFLEGPGIRNWQYANKGMRFINIRLIQGGDIDISSANFINQKDVDEKYQHFLLKEKDYILSTSGTLGRGAIVRKDHLPLLLNTSVIRFQPLDGKGYPFMYEYLKSDIFLNEQKILASGSVQNNFGPTHLKRMKLLLPPSEILNIFNDNMDKLYEKFTKNLEENNTLKSIRDALLPKLVSGKIRVPLEGEE